MVLAFFNGLPGFNPCFRGLPGPRLAGTGLGMRDDVVDIHLVIFLTPLSSILENCWRAVYPNPDSNF